MGAAWCSSGAPGWPREASLHDSPLKQRTAGSGRVRPLVAEEPAIQVGKRAADARSVIAKSAKARVAAKAQPATEPSGRMAVIQQSGPFFAANIACGSGWTNTLGESIQLAGIGRLACTARARAIDLSDGPGGHPKFALVAMLTAPFAAAFRCVPRREPCCLLGEPLALQEA